MPTTISKKDDSHDDKPASSYLDFNSKKSLTYSDKSKIPGAGDGLFAKKLIPVGTSVAVYMGKKITDEEVYEICKRDRDEYQKLNSVIRGTPNGYAIVGEKNTNSNLAGVLVNDIGCISCSKDDLCRDILVKYVETAKKCNLKTVDTSDYPVYVTTKRIKKGDELYAHYGIGYWLLHIGFSPEELTVLNQIYQFEKFY